MGLDIDVAIIGMDTVAQVEENVRIAEAFQPLTAQQERLVIDEAMLVAAGDKKKLFWLPEVRAAG
jgi:predicted aldo/keto reductase-like oxidoreductase